MDHRSSLWTMAAQPGGWGAPPPPQRSGGSALAKGCAVAAAAVIVLIVGSCLALRAFGPSLVRRGVARVEHEVADVSAPIQRQADALGRTPPDLVAACGANTPRLQQAMPCDTYVAWVQQNAPYLAGATARATGFNFRDQNGVHTADITAQLSGPNGAGSLQFTLSRVGNQWAIDSVRRTVDTSTP